jgi:hypothetical protein
MRILLKALDINPKNAECIMIEEKIIIKMANDG